MKPIRCILGFHKWEIVGYSDRVGIHIGQAVMETSMPVGYTTTYCTRCWDTCETHEMKKGNIIWPEERKRA